MKKDTVIDPQWEEEERRREAEREARNHPKRYARQQRALAEVEEIRVESDVIAPWDNFQSSASSKLPRRSKDSRDEALYVEDEVDKVWFDPSDGSKAPIDRKPENNQKKVTPEEKKEPESDLPDAADRFENDDSTPDGEEEKTLRLPTKLKEFIASWISGNILSRSEVRRLYPYLLVMALLMLFYIANTFSIQKLYRRQTTLTRQVKELRSKSLTVSSLRMTSTRQSEIIKELRRRGIGLEELLEPPKVVK